MDGWMEYIAAYTYFLMLVIAFTFDPLHSFIAIASLFSFSIGTFLKIFIIP